MKPCNTSYTLTCKAQVNGQTYYTTSTLAYLPQNPYGGNTVKIDRSTQALLVRNETSGDKTWEKIIPFGFYDVSGLVRLQLMYRATTRPALQLSAGTTPTVAQM